MTSEGIYEQNALGEYQPSIPEPYFVGWKLRKFRCPCGPNGFRKGPTFKTRIDYDEHYFHAHILGRGNGA